MERYRNLSGDSGVAAYEIHPESIWVQFNNSTAKTYVYSHARAGRDHVEQMKRLAVAGLGLNSYIMRNVQYRYDR